MNTNKIMSDRDFQQTLRYSYNDVDASLNVNGFLAGAVGRKIIQTITTTNVANDTQILDFTENSGTLALYQYTVIYSDASQTLMLSAERTA